MFQIKVYRYLSLLLIVLTLTACGADTSVPVTSTTAALPPSITPPTTVASTTSVPATTAPIPTQPIPTVTPIPATTAASGPIAQLSVAPTRPPTAAPVVEPAQAQAIRKTNWPDAIKKDPALQIDPTLSNAQGPYVTVKGNQNIGGYAVFEPISYVDMDGDGIEEAAIMLASGGTAGVTSFVVYKQSSPAPRLTTWGQGYKLRLLVEQGKLVAANALYAGWEPNCCPSGIGYTSYILKDNKLGLAAERSEGLKEALEPTVSHFYDLLNARKFDEAYKLLSDSYQAANPYPEWVKGFAATRKIDAVVKEETTTPNTVRVNLTATDSTSGGSQTTRRFNGTWKLQWNGGLPGWTLNSPAIQEDTAAPKATVTALFKPILTELKAKTSVPILLPTDFGPDDGKVPLYASLGKADKTGYIIDVSFTADCQGANACRSGGVYAQVVASNIPAPTGKSVALSNGLTGYYTDITCGASCGEATLSWRQANVLYTIGSKTANQDSLIKMANSAITNGTV